MKKLLVFIAMLAGSTLCADVEMYGKMNMGIWSFNPERFYKDSISVLDTNGLQIKVIGKDSMELTISSWSPYGTFGAKFKIDKFGGCIEMGTHLNMFDSKFYGSATTARFQRKVSDYISMQKWYAEWYINDLFSLLMGKDFTPTNFFPSNQMFLGGENGTRGYAFNNMGCLSTGPHPMLQLKIKSPNEKIIGKIAIIKADTTAIAIKGKDSRNDRYQCSVKMPKLEGGFNYHLEKGIFSTYGNFAGGYQTYESVLFCDNIAVPKDSCYLKIQSYIVGGDLGIGVGPVSLSFDAFYGENIAVYGAFVGDKFNFWSEKIDGDIDPEKPYVNKYMAVFYPHHQPTDSTLQNWKLYNSTAFALAAILKIKPWDFLAFEGGFGFVSVDLDYRKLMESYHNTIAWYFQTEFKIFKMLKITPEVGRTDYGPRVGYGRYLYFGLNTGIDF